MPAAAAAGRDPGRTVNTVSLPCTGQVEHTARRQSIRPCLAGWSSDAGVTPDVTTPGACIPVSRSHDEPDLLVRAMVVNPR